jgi:uncharacterized protein
MAPRASDDAANLETKYIPAAKDLLRPRLICYVCLRAVFFQCRIPMNETLPAGLNAPPAQSGLAELCRRCNVRRLDIFGSAVTGRFEPERSDLDFLVAFEALAPADYADAYFGLREGLERLFGRDIDLVTEASLSNPYFRDQVESGCQNLFVAA